MDLPTILRDERDPVKVNSLILALRKALAPVVGAFGLREELTANRNYYIRADATGAGNGLTDSAAGAFRHPQSFIDALDSLDLRGFTPIGNITVAGSYNGVAMTKPPLGGSAILLGNTATPTNIDITSSCSFSGGARLTMRGLNFQGITGNALNLSDGAQVRVGSSQFTGTITSYGAILFGAGTSLTFEAGTISISGTLGGGFRGGTGAAIVADGVTFALLSTPTIGNAGEEAFWWSEGNAALRHIGLFTGTFTGRRFNLKASGSLFQNGAPESFIPGTVAGANDGTGAFK